jgi:hypothetical protein
LIRRGNDQATEANDIWLHQRRQERHRDARVRAVIPLARD